MTIGQWIERGKKRLKRYWVQRQNNQQITWLAQQVARTAPHLPEPGSAAPVIFFNASTRLSGSQPERSLFAAVELGSQPGGGAGDPFCV